MFSGAISVVMGSLIPTSDEDDDENSEFHWKRETRCCCCCIYRIWRPKNSTIRGCGSLMLLLLVVLMLMMMIVSSFSLSLLARDLVKLVVFVCFLMGFECDEYIYVCVCVCVQMCVFVCG